MLVPERSAADPRIKCPDVLFDTQFRHLRRADFIFAIKYGGKNEKGLIEMHKLSYELPKSGLGALSDTKPRPDGTLDIGDLAQERADARKPQLMCKYQGTKIVIPYDLPAGTKTCYERGYCE